MGLPGLNQFLERNCLTGVKYYSSVARFVATIRAEKIAQHKKEHGRISQEDEERIMNGMVNIAIDLYQYAHAYNEPVQDIIHQALKLIGDGVLPVYVFDGRPPPQKAATLKKRQKQKEKNLQKLKALKALRFREQTQTQTQTGTRWSPQSAHTNIVSPTQLSWRRHAFSPVALRETMKSQMHIQTNVEAGQDVPFGGRQTDVGAGVNAGACAGAGTDHSPMLMSDEIPITIVPHTLAANANTLATASDNLLDLEYQSDPEDSFGDIDKGLLEFSLKRQRISHDDSAIGRREKNLEKATRTISDYIPDIKGALNLLGIPYVTASGEADEAFALLYRRKQISACLSNDGDILPKECGEVIHIVEHGEVIRFSLSGILRDLKLNLEQFKAFCILIGSDYHDGPRQPWKPDEIYRFFMKTTDINGPSIEDFVDRYNKLLPRVPLDIRLYLDAKKFFEPQKSHEMIQIDEQLKPIKYNAISAYCDLYGYPLDEKRARVIKRDLAKANESIKYWLNSG